MTPRNLTLAEHELVAIGRPALMSLRAAVLREGTADAAGSLREAGYAGGERLWEAFASWTAARSGSAPAALGLESFRSAAGDFFREIGWGTLEIGTLNDAVVTIDSGDWWEADPESNAEEPECHFTTGLLALFFGRAADAPLAVLEVECRSAGAPRCRYLLGAPAVLRYVFDELERGGDYEKAVKGVE